MNKKFALAVVLPVCLSAAAIIAGLSVYSDFPNEFYCGCIEPLESKATTRERLKPCTSLEQNIDWDHSVNIAHKPSEDVDGWEVFGPADPDIPARLSVVLKRDRGEAVWYPRLSGEGSSIELLADDDPGLRLIERIRGHAVWTPIGAQHVLNLHCLKQEFLKEKDIPSRLVFQMSGRWTQIWAKQGAVLF